MSNNSYEILGISENASNDEVKSSFRRLYSNANKEKKQDIYNAYMYIINKNDGLYNDVIRTDLEVNISSNDWNNVYASDRALSDAEASFKNKKIYDIVRDSIIGKRFAEAFETLRKVSIRNSEWHYLYAFASYGVGNNIQALSHAKQANAIAPHVKKYSDFISLMGYRDDRYRNERYNRSRGCGCCGGDCCDCCCDLWCADTCCECTGGDLCECM